MNGCVKHYQEVFFFFLLTVSFATSLKCTLRVLRFSFVGYLSDERIVLLFFFFFKSDEIQFFLLA